MNILIACEESQRVCLAFREKGHNAFSCDILPCSGGHQQFHIQGNCLDLLTDNCTFTTMDGKTHLIEKWDMMVAHPPCTYLTVASARHLYKNSELVTERYYKGTQAAKFFMKLYNANIEKICVENPVPFKIFKLPEYTQIIHPFYFGSKYMKRTCLWLKNLPELKPTNVTKNPISTSDSIWFNKGGIDDRQKIRSKTFIEIANAMAEQWG